MVKPQFISAGAILGTAGGDVKSAASPPERVFPLIRRWLDAPDTDPAVAGLFWTADGDIRCASCRRTSSWIGAATLFLPTTPALPLCWWALCGPCSRRVGTSRRQVVKVGRKVELLLDGVVRRN